jgi:hypothetical protein
MANHVDGEHLETPTNTQSQNFILHKKKWSGYLLEFLMLFLAVFLGFLAENIRENNADRETEKQYMKTMVEDLKSDTAKLTRIIRLRKNRLIELDSLFELISSDRYIKEGDKVYNLYEFPYWDVHRFLPTDRTMQQLKNSGNLRLISHETVSNALIHYDVFVRNLKEYESLQVELANQLNQVVEHLVDPKILHDANKVEIAKRLATDSITIGYKQTFQKGLKIPKMEAATKKATLKYLNEVILLFSALRRDNMAQKELATKTLKLVIKEYNFE